MLEVRRIVATLAISLALAVPAKAQYGPAALVETEPRSPSSRTLPDFSPPRGDLRDYGAPRRNGLIAAMPLGDNVEIGIGRFRVLELARPRTHMEAERAPTDLRRRERGVAAVGMSLRF